jgi:hypothetical protein
MAVPGVWEDVPAVRPSTRASVATSGYVPVSDMPSHRGRSAISMDPLPRAEPSSRFAALFERLAIDEGQKYFTLANNLERSRVL